jgi:hypothetical protein
LETSADYFHHLAYWLGDLALDGLAALKLPIRFDLIG